MRRNGKFSSAEEIEGTGDNFRRGKEEHESGERRKIKSLLGGVADGIPAGLDGDFLINHYWDAEPDIARITNEIQNRAARLKCLGNAVVPHQFYPIFDAIAKIERRAGR